MSRPLYESSSNLQEEVKFFSDLRRLDDYAGYRFQKLPLSYRLECSIEDMADGNIIGFCEFKRRTNRRKQYPTLFLSLHKYAALCDYAKFGESFLFVRWEDFDGVYHVNEHEDSVTDYKIAWGGRRDRGDWQDMEPTIHLPIDHFKIINTERIPLSPQQAKSVDKKWKSGEGWRV